jgi:hypothetical protein
MKLPKGTDKFEVRIAKLLVCPKGKSIFDESVITVFIEDEAAGEFIKVQSLLIDGSEPGIVSFNPEEWPVLREAIDYMVDQCRES